MYWVWNVSLIYMWNLVSTIFSIIYIESMLFAVIECFHSDFVVFQIRDWQWNKETVGSLFRFETRIQKCWLLFHCFETRPEKNVIFVSLFRNKMQKKLILVSPFRNKDSKISILVSLFRNKDSNMLILVSLFRNRVWKKLILVSRFETRIKKNETTVSKQLILCQSLAPRD